MEMKTSDEEAEDGQITKFEQEEEKERKLPGMTVKGIRHEYKGSRCEYKGSRREYKRSRREYKEKSSHQGRRENSTRRV
jgi:hypothetical protein